MFKIHSQQSKEILAQAVAVVTILVLVIVNSAIIIGALREALREEVSSNSTLIDSNAVGEAIRLLEDSSESAEIIESSR